MSQLNEKKVEIIKELFNSNLSEEDLQIILNELQKAVNAQGKTIKILNDIPIYDETDTAGIIKEVLNQ